MIRKYLCLLFSFIVFLSICLPTVLSFTSNTDDNISVFMDMTEEENTEKELAKDSEIKFLEANELYTHVISNKTEIRNHFYIGIYSNIYARIHLPPPEYIFS